jgi:hypothetical protein
MRRQQPRRFQALRACYGLSGYSAGPHLSLSLEHRRPRLSRILRHRRVVPVDGKEIRLGSSALRIRRFGECEKVAHEALGPAEQLRIVRMARPVGERFVFPERSPFHAWQLCVYRRRSGRRVTRSRRGKRHVVRPVASFGCGAARQRPRTAGVAGRYGPCGHQLHKARRGTVWRGKAWERPRATGGPLRPRGGVAVLASVARPRRRTTRAARPSAPPRAARYVAVNARRPLLCARSAPWRVAPWSRDRGS